MARPPTSKTRNVQAVDCLDWSGKTHYGDFRDDLVRDGVAVVKGVLSKEKSAEMVEKVHAYLESFGLGYKRDDPTTHKEECMPVINEKGMMMHYGCSHEDWVWEVRGDKNVRSVFEKVYDTEDLIVSFDCINISAPFKRSKPNTPWAHQDQDPEAGGFRCLQGLVNFLPNGPDDGGLIAMKGAHKISEEFHDHFRSEERIWQWTNEWFGFKEHQLQWLHDKGYTFEKINLEEGDLVLWDSRVPHYNCSPKNKTWRMAVYVCYAPAYTATQEELLSKKDAFETHKGTSHWPQCLQTAAWEAKRPDGTVCPANRYHPINPPRLTPDQFKLTGIPYIASASA